ncbi:MAG: hypothetical protein JWP75_1473 [Frondihabitans sp.]|nr:hypothetical protein [Frondihabitans sp.]
MFTSTLQEPLTPAARIGARSTNSRLPRQSELQSGSEKDGLVRMRDKGEEVGEEHPRLPLAGTELLDLFRPRRETRALLDELRRNPATRAILDSGRHIPRPNAEEKDQLAQRRRARIPTSSPIEQAPDILTMVVDYANGMTQEEIARKHGLHIQTVRKRLKAAGVVTRSRSIALTAQDLDEARGPLDAGLSAREVARRLGVAHTTLLRAIRCAEATTADVNHHHAPRNE